MLILLTLEFFNSWNDMRAAVIRRTLVPYSGTIVGISLPVATIFNAFRSFGFRLCYHRDDVSYFQSTEQRFKARLYSCLWSMAQVFRLEFYEWVFLAYKLWQIISLVMAAISMLLQKWQGEQKHSLLSCSEWIECSQCRQRNVFSSSSSTFPSMELVT